MDPATIAAVSSGGGSVLQSAIGLIGANHGAYKQYKYNSKLQKQAAQLNYKYAKKSAMNSPTWNRAGLESAGYNPMLAVQNGTAGANSSWTSPTNVSQPDYVGSIGNTISNATDMLRLKNENAQSESIVKSNEATARKTNAEATAQEIKNPYVDKQTKNDLLKTMAETSKISSDTDLNYATIENMKSKLELEKQLGFAGIATNRYGIYMDYLGRKYTSDGNFISSIYNSNTMKQIADKHSPSGRSESFRNYMAGVHEGAGAIGDVVGARYRIPRPSTTEEYTEHASFDRNGTYKGHTRTTRRKTKK